jgi:hypothetical protein
VLTIARFIGAGPDHYYVHWPRERFCWFKVHAHDTTGGYS